MIEAFFRKKSRIASIKFGPLGKFADGLAEKLVRNGYSTNMSQGILTRFGELSYYLHSRGVAPGMVNSSTIDDFLSERQSLITINGMENQLRHIVEYLVDMKVKEVAQQVHATAFAHLAQHPAHRLVHQVVRVVQMHPSIEQAPGEIACL